MTISELINILKTYPPDSQIKIRHTPTGSELLIVYQVSGIEQIMHTLYFRGKEYGEKKGEVIS